jgi:RNA polymerase sigma-70 factor (ECF subfamily)
MSYPASHLIPAISDDVGQPEPVSYDDPFLVRLRDRDPRAFDRLVADQAGPVQRLVARLLGWESDCEDVVQEVFMAAWESANRFRGQSTIQTWLFSIAINQCRRQRRKRGRRKQIWQRLVEQDAAHRHRPVMATPGITLNAIHAAVNRLPHRDREVIVLCTLEGNSADEAARLLGVRKNTVEVRLHRARQKLKDLLKKDLDE